MKKNLSWVVREGDEGDLEGIFSLRKIVFRGMEEEKLDEKFWRWEFEKKGCLRRSNLVPLFHTVYLILRNMKR